MCGISYKKNLNFEFKKHYYISISSISEIKQNTGIISSSKSDKIFIKKILKFSRALLKNIVKRNKAQQNKRVFNTNLSINLGIVKVKEA